jgi:hypothetical protein
MSACILCGGPSDYQHHPTGRIAGEDSPYLDPTYTVGVCHDDHYLIHDDLKTLGLEP